MEIVFFLEQIRLSKEKEEEKHDFYQHNQNMKHQTKMKRNSRMTLKNSCTIDQKIPEHVCAFYSIVLYKVKEMFVQSCTLDHYHLTEIVK